MFLFFSMLLLCSFFRIKELLISSFLEIDFAINISDKKSLRFDLSEVIFKCIKTAGNREQVAYLLQALCR